MCRAQIQEVRKPTMHMPYLKTNVLFNFSNSFMTLYYFCCGFISKYSPRILHICSIIVYIFVLCSQLIISTQHILTMGISLCVFLQLWWYSLDHGRLFSYPVAGALCPHWCRRWGQACRSPRLSTWEASTTQASCSSHYVSVWVLCIWKGFRGHTETKVVVFFFFLQAF